MGLGDKIKDLAEHVKDEAKALIGEKGKNKEFTSKKAFDETSIKQAFYAAKARLFDVNSWSKIGPGTSTFQLYDATGSPLSIKKPHSGNFIKIILPGIKTENWVKVVDIKEGNDLAEFVVQPSHHPVANDKSKTEHFFQDDARSIFRVEIHGNEIVASEIGVNEVINNQGEEAGERKILNTAIAEGGWAGFQKYQWTEVTDYVIGKK